MGKHGGVEDAKYIERLQGLTLQQKLYLSVSRCLGLYTPDECADIKQSMIRSRQRAVADKVAKKRQKREAKNPATVLAAMRSA